METIIYFDDISYVKLWSLLSSSALISANVAHRLVTLHLLREEQHLFCSQHEHSLMSWRDVHIGQEQTTFQLIGNGQINCVSDLKKSKH